MPEYTIETHDGSYTVNLDGDLTPERVQAILDNMEPEPEPQSLPALERARRSARTTPAEAIAGNPATRYLMGITDMAIGGPAQLGTAVGGWVMDKAGFNDPYAAFNKVNEFRDRYKDMERAGMDEAGTRHNIAGALGQISAGAGAMSRYAIPKDMVPRMLQGAAQGFTLGAAAPVDSDSYAGSKAGQMALGTVLGGAIPPIASYAADTIRSGAGATGRYIGELANRVAGSERGRIISALRSGSDDFHLTPSQMAAPSGGMVNAPRGSSSFANLMNRVMKHNKNDKMGFVSRRMQSIVNTLKNTFRSDNVDDLLRTRKANSDPFFAAARESDSVVDTRSTQRLIGQMLDENPNDSLLRKWLENVRGRLSRSQTVTPAQPSTRTSGIGSAPPGSAGSSRNVPVTSVRELDSLAGDMRRILQEAAGDAPPDRRHFAMLARVKSQLQDDIGNVNADYRTALENFRRDSIPLNQAMFGREVNRQLERATTERARQRILQDALDNPDSILKNIDDITIDFRNIDDLATPEQISVLGQTRDAMGQVVRNENLARGADATVDQAINDVGVGTFPNPLNRVLMVLNRAARDTESVGTIRTLQDLSKLSPEQLARLMERFNPDERVLLNQFLGFSPVMGAIQATDNSMQSANDQIAEALAR